MKTLQEKIGSLEKRIKTKYRLLHRAERMVDQYEDDIDIMEERLGDYLEKQANERV